MSPILQALSEQLDSDKTKDIAASALLRHHEILKPEVMKDIAEPEARACVGILVPVAIGHLSSINTELSQASLKVLKLCLSWDDPKCNIITDTMKYIQDQGVKSPDDETSIAIMKILPKIYRHILEVMSMLSLTSPISVGLTLSFLVYICLSMLWLVFRK